MAKASEEQLAAFGAALKAFLMAEEVSRSDLADALDVTPQAVDYYVQGKREPDPRTVQIMEDLLDVPGQLMALLGYQTPNMARLTSVETELRRVRGQLEQALELLRAAGLRAPTPPRAAPQRPRSSD